MIMFILGAFAGIALMCLMQIGKDN